MVDTMAIKNRLDECFIALADERECSHQKELLSELLEEDTPCLLRAVTALKAENAELIEFARGECKACKNYGSDEHERTIKCVNCLNENKNLWI